LIVIAASLALTLGLGLYAARGAGRSKAGFFLSDRRMPWWALGISMVATTFSADTPNLVTDIVRQHGVAGNWMWWSFLLTGMVTVFLYAHLWRRSGVTTDLEFYELRYSGKQAAFLRGFRAVYLGLFFNVMIMALVTMAAIKIGAVMLGLPAVTLVVGVGLLTLAYSISGGLRAVIWTDVAQFGLAMVGSIGATVAILRLPQINGVAGLLSHPDVIPKLSLLPDFTETQTVLAIFIVPLAVQWWSAWYPGSEPGGGGYVAQRMLAAKNEQHAKGAALFFNVAHYALRPWPWILIALASLIVFPDLVSLQERFPEIDPAIVKHDLAYPAMLTFLPAGLLGLVLASLLAAVMSTLSTHLNWGASYLVNDLYQRFVEPDASERRLVWVGRWFTLGLMICAGGVALLLQNALQAFQILLQVGAGTGLIFLLRWFWWRVNAQSEIAAMISSFLFALYFQTRPEDALPAFAPYVINVAATTVIWITVAFLTSPTDPETLRKYCDRVRPWGRGWRRFNPDATPAAGPAAQLAAAICGIALTYAILFGIGFTIYDNLAPAIVCGITAAVAGVGLVRLRPLRRSD
jgi:SSS family solute:Na+ symporter